MVRKKLKRTMVNKPRPYDLSDPTEKERLLRELSGYLGSDMDCRKAFLEDGTDAPGRRFAIRALDEIRKRR